MHALCLVPVIIPRLFLTRVEDFCPVSILWFFSSFPSCSVAWELGRSSLLWEQAEPFLLELCVLLDGDHVHGGVRGHCLPHRVRQGLSGPFSSRRIGKLFQISVLSLKVWKPTNNVANCLTCYENLDWGFFNKNWYLFLKYLKIEDVECCSWSSNNYSKFPGSFCGKHSRNY